MVSRTNHQAITSSGDSAAETFRNRIIAALPEQERTSLLRHAQRMQLKQKHSFYGPDEPLQHAYFLERGMSSELLTLRDGRTVDTGPLGSEGMVGLPILFGERTSRRHCLMQLDGEGWRVPAENIRELYESLGALRRLLSRYMHARLLQATQSSACNLLHTVEQRLSRWLLMAHDEASGDVLSLTQEFLSEMLGVNRSTVTLTAATLERAGLIEYRRGVIRIVNRTNLVHTSCECYAVIRRCLDSVTHIPDREWPQSPDKQIAGASRV